MAKKRLTAAEKRAAEEIKKWESLRKTAPAKPDVAIPPIGGDRFSVGYDFLIERGFGTGADHVYVFHAWSTSHTNGRGSDGPSRLHGGSQGGKALYSTEELALRAARLVIERRAVESLYTLDQRIAGHAKRREAQDKLSASLMEKSE